MKRKPDKPLRSAALRGRGETPPSRSKTAGTDRPLPEMDMQRLLRELQGKQAELEMRNEELLHTRDAQEATLVRYSHLFDFAPVGYMTLGRDVTIRSVNLTGAGMLGVSRSRLMGRSFLRFVSRPDTPAFSAFIEAVFKHEGNSTCETLLQTTDKRRFHARIEAAPCEPGNECLVTIVDISASKETEKALQESRRQLERLNGSLELCVNAAVEELRRKDRMLLTQNRQAAMGEMIGCIAHQWRQPLNTLSLNIQRLGLFYDLGRFSKEFLDTSIEDAKRLIQHMSQTIDDFRNFFSNDKEAVTFDVRRSVGAAVTLVKDSLKARRITLDVRMEGNPTISGYPNEYAQALLNIILNAQDALLERGVQEPRITVASCAENGRAVVTVTDNAGGIPADVMERIFDPYFTTKGPDKGTGVGLFMAKTIIETNMRGRLTARNVADGAEFRIEV